MSKLQLELLNLQSDLSAISKLVPSGSYFICGKKTSDIDYFIQSSGKVHQYLKDNGFRTGFEDADASFENDAKFISYTKDAINVICVKTRYDLDRIQLATDLCKALKLSKKEDRLFVFNALRLGKVSNKRSTELEACKT